MGIRRMDEFQHERRYQLHRHRQDDSEKQQDDDPAVGANKREKTAKIVHQDNLYRLIAEVKPAAPTGCAPTFWLSWGLTIK
jgi:hypothetical protein